MMQIALCDDNSAFLSKMCKQVEYAFLSQKIECKIKCFLSGRKLLIENKVNPFDVLFLDIDMPELSGFDLAKELKTVNPNCYIIFVTAHSEMVYDSFYFQPLNFITKTDGELFEQKLKTVVNQLVNNMNQQKIIVLENKDLGRKAIYLKDILFIESEKHYSIYHINRIDNCVTVRESITNLREKYTQNDFVRIHKKYLVNLRYVFNIDRNKDTIKFKQGFELPMSRNYKADVDEKLTEYLRRTK